MSRERLYGEIWTETIVVGDGYRMRVGWPTGRELPATPSDPAAERQAWEQRDGLAVRQGQVLRTRGAARTVAGSCSGLVQGLSVSPNRRLLAVACEESDQPDEVRLFSYDDTGRKPGELLARVVQLTGAKTAYVISPDGHVELLGAPDPEEARRLACRVGPRLASFEACAASARCPGLLRRLLARP